MKRKEIRLLVKSKLLITITITTSFVPIYLNLRVINNSKLATVSAARPFSTDEIPNYIVINPHRKAIQSSILT